MCVKYFVGDGGIIDGINGNNIEVSYDELVNIYMKVYKDVIDKGVIIIMVFYSSWNGVKMYVNYFLLIKVLKE